MEENSLGAAQERLLAWYRRLEQEAEEQRRREEAARQRTLAPAPSEASPPEAAPPAGTPGVRPASTSAPATPPPRPDALSAPHPAHLAEQAVTAVDTAGATVEAAPPPAAGAEAVRPRAPRKRRPPRPVRSTPTATEAAAAAQEAELDPSLLAHLSEPVRRLLLEPEKETAQNYYAIPFRETRAQLIRRLLDPPLTLEETARILNVCPMTVRRYTNRGILRHFRTAGDQRRFRLSDVLAFVESHGRPHDD